MRHLILTAMLLGACATPSGATHSTTRSARASTRATDALVRGDHADALTQSERGLAKDPRDPWLLYDRGIALAELGRADEALRALGQAELRFGNAHDRSLAVYRRAMVLEDAGRCAEAADEYARYAAILPAYERPFADDPRTHLAFCMAPPAQQQAEREERARLMRASRDGTLQKTAMTSTAAASALAVGDYTAALARADQGLKITPDESWLLYEKGAALAGLERTDEALPILRQAERQFAEADDVHGQSVAAYRRSMALEVAGRCDEERNELRHYAALVRPTQPNLTPPTMTHLKSCRLANIDRTTF